MTIGEFTLSAKACTHVGRIREQNEDSFLVHEELLAVADGLGGHAGGDAASEAAIEALTDFAESQGVGGRNRRGGTKKRKKVSTAEALRQAFAAAHFAVLDRAASDVKLSEMCTTLCALALDPEGMIALANVGDSRIYRLADGELEQLTWDHVNYNELIRHYGCSPTEAMNSMNPMSLSRVLGVFPEPAEVDTWEHEAVEGHRYLLTSDGLTGELTDEEITEVLRSLGKPDEAADELVRQANDCGGRDNITVVVADVTKTEKVS